MSIQGSHLEKLYHLRRRIEDEIRMEERRVGRREAKRAAIAARGGRRASPVGPTVEDRALAAGVTAREVKEWAVTVGLIPVAKRGRLRADLLDQYLAAHADQEQGVAS